MRLVFALALSLAVGSGTAAAQVGKDLPKLKPGLWEMKMSLAEMGGMGQTVETCVGEETQEMLTRFSDERADCEHQSVRKDGNRVLFDARCTVEGSKTTIQGVFSGDFGKQYQGEIRTAYNPPLHGMATTTMKQEARWLGACKPGQKPGDVVMKGMPNLGDINIEEMMKNAPQAPRR